MGWLIRPIRIIAYVESLWSLAREVAPYAAPAVLTLAAMVSAVTLDAALPYVFLAGTGAALAGVVGLSHPMQKRRRRRALRELAEEMERLGREEREAREAWANEKVLSLARDLRRVLDGEHQLPKLEPKQQVRRQRKRRR